jgi:hypothetical protein
MQSRDLKRLSFKLFLNEAGEHFPLNNRSIRIESIEIRRSEQMFDVPMQIG